MCIVIVHAHVIGDRPHACVPTFVPDQPSLKATSFANSSPNPSINPLTKGSNRLIAAPLSSPHAVGGVYSIIGRLGGDGEGEGESDMS